MIPKIPLQVRSLFFRLRRTLFLLKHKKRFINCATYYPECEQKTALQIIKDQLFLFGKKEILSLSILHMDLIERR